MLVQCGGRETLGSTGLSQFYPQLPAGIEAEPGAVHRGGSSKRSSYCVYQQDREIHSDREIRSCFVEMVHLLFNLSVTVCVFTYLCTTPAEAGHGIDAGPQTSVQFLVTGAQAAHELRPPASTHTQNRAGHPDQPLRVLRLGKHTQPVDRHKLHAAFYVHLYSYSL